MVVSMWKNIVEKVLESTTRIELEIIEMDKLFDNLQNEIDEKWYLVILDDVWNVDDEKRSNLKKLLMIDARGNKILITTPMVRLQRLCFQVHTI